jgi:hypothetical protein
VALWDLGRRVRGFRGRRLGVMLYRIGVAGAVTADVALAVSVALAHVLGTAGGALLLFRLAVVVGVGVCVYVCITRYFGVDEVRSLLQFRRPPTS